MARVLFAAESFHPVLGGGEKHIREMSASLAASGLGVSVLTRRGQKDWPREERLDGVRVLRVPPCGPGRIGKYAMVPPMLAALRRERDTYDVVSVCGTRVLGWPVLARARRLGKRVVLQAEMTGEMSGEIYVWGTPLHHRVFLKLMAPLLRLRNRALRRADAFVAISRPIEQEFLAAGLPRERVHYIPHAVDTDRFRPAEPGEAARLRVRLGLPSGALLVVFTGRLLKGKGLEYLIEAWAELAPALPRIHLAILGSGAGQMLSVEDEIKARAQALGLAGRITFTGRVENVDEYLRAGDVFVFPSVFEGLPHSIVEAAAAGLPSVASRAGGIPDVIVDQENGLLVPPADSAALAQALRAMIGTDEMRARMAARAREIASARFSLTAVTREYRDLFEGLAGANARPSV
ncbi:MAG: glycosyltransferase family 4 protein [Vicinamibacteria bacterium]|jgi:glycosyltransferase involved in cell wall biosynthesis|nr:glycosyltransferase family 4 protein [Vicinamibacteria bacterium]